MGSYEKLIGGSTPWAWQALAGHPFFAQFLRGLSAGSHWAGLDGAVDPREGSMDEPLVAVAFLYPEGWAMLDL